MPPPLKKKTNPIGPDTENLSINMPKEWKHSLKGRAKESNMKIGEYCRYILIDAAKRGVKIERTVSLKIGE